MAAAAEVLERALAIARDVLGPSCMPCARIDGAHIVVGTERVNEDTGEVFEYWLARSDGVVTAPRIAAALGIGPQIEALARQLAALDVHCAPAPEPPEQVDQESYDEICARMRQQVAVGVLSLEEVLSGYGWDLPDDPRTVRRLRLEVIDAARALLAAEATWPSPNDTDRLAAAFAELEQRGVSTAFGHPPTNSGGWESVREHADELAEQGVAVWGAAFFHEQDIEHALAGRGVCIAFGGLDRAASVDDARAAETVLEVLRGHGLAPVWNGSVDTKIELKDFAWQRRRSAVDRIDELRLDDDMPLEVLEVLPQLRRLRFDPERIAIARVASPSVEHVTLDYALNDSQPHVALEIEAALPALRAQVRAQFPQLRTLTVEAGPLRDVTTW